MILAALDGLGRDFLVFLEENILPQLGLCSMLSLGVSMSSSNKVSEAESRGSLCALASSRYGPLEVRLKDSSGLVAIARGVLDREDFRNAVVSTALVENAGNELVVNKCDIVGEGLCIVGLSVNDGDDVSAADCVRNVGSNYGECGAALEAKRIESRRGTNLRPALCYKNR